jgi:hypothetical protein
MKRLCHGIVGLLCAITNAAAQSTDQLEQQLLELKQQYAESTRTMEQRISALEKQIEAQQIAKNQATPATRTPGTVSLADLAAQHPWNEWISFGARPEVFFTKHNSLAFEGGVDHTHCIAGCVSQSDWPDRPLRWLAAQGDERPS